MKSQFKTRKVVYALTNRALTLWLNLQYSEINRLKKRIEKLEKQRYEFRIVKP